MEESGNQEPVPHIHSDFLIIIILCNGVESGGERIK